VSGVEGGEEENWSILLVYVLLSTNFVAFVFVSCLSWIPVGSIGSHLHDVNANIQTGKFGVRAASPRKKTLTKPPHKCVPDYPVKAIMNGEVKIHIVRKHLQHKAFKGLATHDQLSFLAFCDNIWCLDTATNDRSRVRYEVIAESQHGPQLCTYDQVSRRSL